MLYRGWAEAESRRAADTAAEASWQGSTTKTLAPNFQRKKTQNRSRSVLRLRYRFPIGALIGATRVAPSAPTKRVDFGGTAKIYASETVDLGRRGGQGGRGGTAARWREERTGGGEKRGGWRATGWSRFAHIGGATKRRAARGRKKTLASFFHRKQNKTEPGIPYVQPYLASWRSHASGAGNSWGLDDGGWGAGYGGDVGRVDRQ
jgi:hypothetical protein